MSASDRSVVLPLRRPLAAQLASLTLAVAITHAAPMQEQERPTFGSSVVQVRVDVIVTDGDGHFVDDLLLDDFRVFEDGVPQQLLSAQLVDVSLQAPSRANSGPREGARTAAGDMRSEPGAESSSPATRGASSELGAIVFVIDLPSLDQRSKHEFAAAWAELLSETEGFGVPRAAFVIKRRGGLEEIAPLTFDVDLLRQAAEQIRSMRSTARPVGDRLLAVGNEDTPRVRAEARYEGDQDHQRCLDTLELLTELCDSLVAQTGRTALVWVTSGIQLSAAGPWAMLDDPEGARADTYIRAFTPDPEVLELQSRLHQCANSSNVSIYSVAPTRRPALQYDVRQGPRSRRGDSRLMMDALDGLGDGLKEAADETGGKAFIGWSSVKAALQEIRRDTEKYYLLSYAPPAPHGDGEYHEIAVQVVHPGMNVRARSGYVDLDATQRHFRGIAAGLTLPGLVTDLPLAVGVFRKWSDEGQAVVKLVVAVDGHSLTYQSTDGNDVTASLEVHALAIDGDGAVAVRTHEAIETRLRSSDATYPASARPVIYAREWTLEPGEYDVRIVVRDASTGRLGAKQVEVRISEPDTAWQASDLMLLSSDGASGPEAIVGGRLEASDLAVAYLEVQGSRAPILSGQILDEGGVSQVAELDSVRLRSDAYGIHRGWLPLPQLRSGSYILQVLVSDPPTGNYRVFRLPLTASSSEISGAAPAPSGHGEEALESIQEPIDHLALPIVDRAAVDSVNMAEGTPR